MSSSPRLKLMTAEFKSQVAILGTFLAIFWGVEAIDWLIFQGHLDRFGIIPHHPIGLRGIFLAPFLHGNFTHLAANTVPFATLGWLVMVQRTRDFWYVTAITAIVGGIGVWLFGAPQSVHIGASILIFGYLGFLLFRGYFQRDSASIALSLLALVFYGSLIGGILPTDPRVSWQGHLFGFIGGIVAARQIARSSR